MTEEQKHILEYIKTILPTIWDNLSDYAKEDNLTELPYEKVEDLLKDIEGDTDLMEWYFFEALSHHIDNNLLKELLVYADNNNEYFVYKVSNKFIKVWWEVFQAHYKFIEEEAIFPTITIELLLAENKKLKQELFNLKNNVKTNNHK